MSLWLLLAGLSLQGPPGSAGPEGFETLQPYASWCGPRVLYFFARWSGSGATLEDVVRLCEPDAEGYTSLAKLSEAARKLGLEPRAARAEVAEDDGEDLVVGHQRNLVFDTVESDVRIENFRCSVGAGLRLVVPMFGPLPIALDWAVPVAKAPFDDKRIFSFYVGFTR